MLTRPPIHFSPNRILLQRAVRSLLWPNPYAYLPFGLLRKRGNVLNRDVDLYISGYPRSGNTFARNAFLSINPEARVRSHRHIPAFVIRLAGSGIPGMILIRNPLDAAVSWAIHERQTLEESIAYWNDYYQALMPLRSQLFVVRFEEVTADFGGVIRAFNARWRTDFTQFEHTAMNAARCFQLTEEEHRKPSGEIREMQVCRPSPQRLQVKEAHLGSLNQSGFLRDELARAKELYETFAHFRPVAQRGYTSRLVPGSQASEAGAEAGA